MALPVEQQTQVGSYEKILTIANRILHGGEITKEEAIDLIHTSDEDTMILLAMACLLYTSMGRENTGCISV